MIPSSDPEPPPISSSKGSRSLARPALIASLVFQSTFVFLGMTILGIWLDRRFLFSPVFTLLFFFLGLIFASILFLRILRVLEQGTPRT